MFDFREFLFVATGVAGIVCVVVLAMVGIIHAVEPIKCEQRSVSFEDHKWGFFSRRMVKLNGEWVPLRNVRFIEDE